MSKATFPGRDSGRAAESTCRRLGHAHPKDVPRLLRAPEDDAAPRLSSRHLHLLQGTAHNHTVTITTG